MAELDINNKPPELCIPIELTKFIYQSRQGKVIDQNYENKIYDQTLQGQSKIQFQNGNQYEGNLNQGYMDGQGTLRCFNGIIYTGEFKLNVIEGKGRYEWPDGSFYEGELHLGLRHGQGIYTSPNKEIIYEGQWENGLRHGQGTLSWKNGQKYTGGFSKGFKNGKGKMMYPNGNHFEGDWKFDKKDGYGQMNWNTTNEKYMGHWKNNIQNGEGIHIWLENKGEVKEMRNRYEGSWMNGERHGYGTFYYADGSKYEGEWKKNKKEGFGIFTEVQGEVQVGEFKADRFIKQMKQQVSYAQPKKKQKKTLYQQQQEKAQQEKEQQIKLQQAKDAAKKGQKAKKFEQQKQEELEKEKMKEELLKEEKKRKLEIQLNPFCTQIDIEDLIELKQNNKLEIISDLVQILLRHNSTIKSLYKSIQQKYDNTIGEVAFCLDMKAFWQFCRETKILDSNLTLASINRLFFQGSKNRFDIVQNQDLIERKVNILKQMSAQKKKISNSELSNINMIEMLDQIKAANVSDLYSMSEKDINNFLNQEQKQAQAALSESKIQHQKKHVKPPIENIHNGKTPILLRHFIDLLIRTAYLKYQDVDDLGHSVEKLIFEKIQYQLEKQKMKLQSQTGSSNPSQVKSSSVTVSFLEDTDFSARYKKAQEYYTKDIEGIFDKLAEENRNTSYGFIDKTCKVKIFYKMLIKAGYIKDISDKHIIFHVVEKCYDPTSLISALDQQLKQADRNAHNISKRGKNHVNTDLKKYIDKLKQKRLIIMLESEIISFEFSELLLNFLCRKDKDMSHTKNEDNFKKKLGAHLMRIKDCVNTNSFIDKQGGPGVSAHVKKERNWPRTTKDDMKDKLAKERVKKNKILQEQQRERELKMREARERLNMEKEDFNVPEQNDLDYEDFDESEIEIYDDDYLANF